MSPSINISPIDDISDFPECIPNLMPFHITYTGPAPISVYMSIEPAASELVGAPSNATLVDSGGDSVSEGENIGDVVMKEVSTESVGDETSLSTRLGRDQTPSPTTLTPEVEIPLNPRDTTLPPPSPTSSRMKQVAAATTRFISSFRGRVIQGMKVELPVGYVGLVLRDEKEEVVSGTKGKSKSKTKDTAKAKAPESQGRTTRGTKRTQSAVPASQVVEEDAMDVSEEEFEMPDDTSKRTFIPTSQFSSFVLWHADIPADGGRDEYFRALSEWTQLSHEVRDRPR